jgi:response regulator of citrate/malate metabolism
MGELHDWLSHQHHGLKTFKALRQNMLDRVAEEYIAKYDGEAVPVDVAEQTFSHLLEIVAKAEGSLTASPAHQIQILNELAAARLV